MKRLSKRGVLCGAGAVVAGAVAAGAIVIAGAGARPSQSARASARASSSASGPKAPSNALFPVLKGGKWGYINREGKIVIALQFASARPFREGRALACNEGGDEDGHGGADYAIGSCGFIGTDGQWAMRPSPGYYKDFSDGLARATIRQGSAQDGKVVFDGWVDAVGKRAFALPAGTSEAESFHEGFAVATVPVENPKEYGESLFGVLDRRGRWAIEPRLKAVLGPDGGDYRLVGTRDFSHGLAVCPGERDPAHVGFINAAGKFVIAPRFYGAQPFSEGMAKVQVLAEHSEREVRTRSGFIDIAGKMVIPARYRDAQPFANGLAAAEDESFHWGYIDPKGNWAIQPRFDHATDFSEELAPQQEPNGTRYGFIDKRGRWGIEPRFDAAQGFENGLASAEVRLNEKRRDDPAGGPEATILSYDLTRGIIDHAGRWVWKSTEHVEEHQGAPTSGTS